MIRHRRIVIAVLGLSSLAVAVNAQAAGPTFSVPTQLPGGTVIQGMATSSGGGEPSISADGQGNLMVGAPQGVGGGEGFYWVSHDDGASWGTPANLGGAHGGGDEDNVFAPQDGSQYAGRAYIADLGASASTVCTSTDHGSSFAAVGPAPDPLNCHAEETNGQVGPSSDRQWLTVDKGGRAYLTYHEFVSAQPLVFTTVNGGADGFTAGPCGPIVTDPTIEANVPQDITGGTLVSKPVVDSAGNLYILFTTTTQTQNVMGFPTSIAGTYSQAYLAVSTDHCASFTDHTIYDGAASHPANSVQFGDIFNDLAIDAQDNLYVVAAGFIGTTAFATKSDVFLFTSPAASHGATWSAPQQVNTDVGAHMLPAAVAGLSTGQLAIGYFKTGTSQNANNAADQWTYTIAETNDAFDATPVWAYTDLNSGEIYHSGDICNSGILCGTMLPGTGTDRSLADFTSGVLDSDGCPLFTFAGNPASAQGNTYNYVTKQTSTCFQALAANTPEVPWAAGVLVVGVAAVAVTYTRRRRGFTTEI